MRPPSALAVALVLLPALCTPRPAPTPEVRVPAAVQLGRHQRLEREVAERINEERRARGLPPLAYDLRVAEVARRHSDAMAQGRTPFSHEGFQARAARVAALVPMETAAENIASNHAPAPETARTAVEGWLDSPSHRVNIHGRFDVTGVGIARTAAGEYYFTQLFVRRRAAGR